MKVDRSLFLVLTGTLAGACHIYVDEPPPQTAATPPPPTANQSPPSTAVPPPPPQPQPGSPAQPQTPAPLPQTPSPPQRTIPIHLHGGSSPAPAPGQTACLDANASTVPDCAAMKAPDPSCAPFPFPQQRCATYKSYFDPKVAAVAVSCMNALSSKQVCDGSQTYNCGKAALAQACPDSTVGQLCAIAATSCKSTPAECTSLLSGLNDQGKQQVAQCVAQGCTGGLYSCIEGLH
jgi:hypothetical protein